MPPGQVAQLKLDLRGEQLALDAARRTEASLRGAIENATLSEDELRQLEEERETAEASARLRNQDYQLAYAIDILTGLNALGPRQ